MTPSNVCLLAIAVALPCACAQTASKGNELRIKLTGHDSTMRNHVRYSCDSKAAKLKLPAGPFTVEYIAVGNNGLAIIPVDGERIIFSRVASASGERFAAGWNEWGDKGNDAWLTSTKTDAKGNEITTYCHEVK